MRNCGMILSGRSYITCRSVLLAAAASSELSVVSWEQAKSKDVPCSCKVLKWGLFRLPAYVANVTKVSAKFSG